MLEPLAAVAAIVLETVAELLQLPDELPHLVREARRWSVAYVKPADDHLREAVRFESETVATIVAFVLEPDCLKPGFEH